MDRRVRKTRRALRESLFSLIAERGWDGVNVQHVCERADVGRSTFYTHFADREDLLLSGFDDLKIELRAGDPRPLGWVRGLLEHVAQNRRLARLLTARRGAPPVRKRITRLVVALIEEDLATLAPPSPTRSGAAHFLAGALVDVILWRLEDGTPLSEDELEALFQRLSAPVLQVVQSPSDAA